MKAYRKLIERSNPELDHDGGAPPGDRDSQDDSARARDDDRADAGAHRQHAGADPGRDGGQGREPPQNGGPDDDLEDHRKAQDHDDQQEQVQGQVQRLFAAAEAEKAEAASISEDQQEADLAARLEDVQYDKKNDSQAEESDEQEGDDGHGESQDC